MARFTRSQKSILTSLLGLLVVGIYLVVQSGSVHHTTGTLAHDTPGSYRINHFIDGDTIAVNMNGHIEKVRFIGVDTPETHKPNTPVQCYGPAAAAFTKATIGNGQVRLVADSLSTNRDRYNRLLRYVYTSDGTDLNELLITTGHGFYYPYFPFSKSAQFAADENRAKEANTGLWGACKPMATDDGGYTSNPE